jgi:uncharacterized Zn finger protein
MKMKCDYCGKVTSHTFIGKQDYPKFTVEMYDCDKCGSTHSVKVTGTDKPDNTGNKGIGYQEWNDWE